MLKIDLNLLFGYVKNSFLNLKQFSKNYTGEGRYKVQRGGAYKVQGEGVNIILKTDKYENLL